MKQIRFLMLTIFVMSAFATLGQEQELAERLGSHKGWNVAYVNDLRVDSSLTLNAILIQAYDDREWDSLLVTVGMSSGRASNFVHPSSVLIRLADRNTLEQRRKETVSDDDCLVFCRCSERTVAIFFPHNLSDRERIISSYLSKGQFELYQFAQRRRKK